MLAINTSGVEAYAKWLDAQAAELELAVRTIYRAWAIAIHKEITELTPQWSGNLASNWALDIGAPNYAAVYYAGPAADQPISEGTRGGGRQPYSRGMYPAVGRSLDRAKQVGLPGLRQSLYIHNPVEYADSIEADSTTPPVRAINRLPRSETGKIAMVYYAHAKHSANGQAFLNELRSSPR